MDNVKKTDVDYTENNGCIGHPITNQLMEQARAAEQAELPEDEQDEQPEGQP